jgi:hypothetical protein
MPVLDKATLDFYEKWAAPSVSMNKGVPNAACWNFALFGAQPVVPAMQIPFDYLSRAVLDEIDLGAVLRGQAEAEITANVGGAWDALQATRPARVALDAIRTTYDQGDDTTATRLVARQAGFLLSIQIGGLTVSAQQTPYRVVMYTDADCVGWEHWWLEINGCVVETVTGAKLYGASTEYLSPDNHARDRFVAAQKQHDKDAYHAAYVTGLHQSQVNYLNALHGFATKK